MLVFYIGVNYFFLIVIPLALLVKLMIRQLISRVPISYLDPLKGSIYRYLVNLPLPFSVQLSSTLSTISG